MNKNYYIAVSKEDVHKCNYQEVTGEIVFCRDIVTMVSDACAIQTIIGTRIYDGTSVERLANLCLGIREACLRAVECEVVGDVVLHYGDVADTIPAEAVASLTDRNIQTVLSSCPNIIKYAITLL